MWNKEAVSGQQSAVGDSGILFMVSAPSGAGKTTLCRKAVDYFHDLRHSVSYTTRSPRDGERDGIDYHFITKETFHKMINGGEFLEWAEVHGNRYGTSFNETKKLLACGLDIILDIDVQGARQIKLQIVNFKFQIPGVFIFVLPPSLEDCEKRIRNRGKDSYEAILSRLENARNEIKEMFWYEYVIINENLEDAFERLKSVIIAERSKRERMMGKLKGLYPTFLKE